MAAIASPTGPRAAAKNGAGLMSVGATAKAGFDALALHWDVMEERAPQFGHIADRSKWRLAGPMHLADTREQAIEDVRYGLDAWCDYTQNVLAAPHFRAAGSTFEERVSWVNDTGLGVIGTVEDAIAQIERLEEQSGGFGSYLLIHQEWARHAATLKSYELFANHVKPRFQGSTSASRAGLGLRQSPAGRSSTSATPTRSKPPPTATPKSARGTRGEQVRPRWAGI